MKSLNQYITEFVVKKHIQSSYKTVDLDLPSGLKWATCNIGAEKPEDYGLLFQWGRVDGYKYDDKNHKFLYKNDYVTTSGTEYHANDTLKTEDDAAYQATNGELRMPTAEEIEELLEYTTNRWTKLNGVNGRKFRSKKDKSKWIFIPAAGYFNGVDGSFYETGSDGWVWSSSARSYGVNDACGLRFYSNHCNPLSDYRCYGLSVRGVCE